MNSDRSLGRWIKQRRRELDLTQHDLARLIGCAVVTIQKIEEGRRRPSRQMAGLLAGHLALPVKERGTFLELARGVIPPSGAAEPAPPPSNVPMPLTGLIGRADDIAAICNALERADVRLLTLVGPPGVGKTRLGVEASRELDDSFPDGVWFVALAPLDIPELVIPTIARVVGVTEVGTEPLIERLKTALRLKRALLVLDNLEQVVDAGPLITDLLAACHQVKALATSRVPLHLYGEHVYAVEPFALPDHRFRQSVEDLSAYDAIRLFVARARALRPHFSLTPDHAQAIVDICTRLDGLPLAIELAAARIGHLTPEAIAAQLGAVGQALPLLSSGPHDLPARQQSLANAITWSYNLLDEEQQALFRRLGVFAGGCTAAAAKVCSGASDERLAALVEQSLIRREMPSGVEARYSLLEMIREYALARLTECGERSTMEQQHAEYFLQTAEDVQDEVVWLTRMGRDYDNLRAALQWALEHDASQTGLRLCNALWWFWETRGYWREGRAWLEMMVAAAGAAAPVLRMEALRCAGSLAWKQGDYARAAGLLHESLRLSRGAGTPAETAQILLELGKTALDQGNTAEAEAILGECLALRRASCIAEQAPLFHLAEAALAQRNYARAQTLVEASLAAAQGDDDTFFTTLSLRLLGETALRQGDHRRARSLLEQSLRLSREVQHPRVIAFSLTSFAAAIAYGEQPPAEGARRAARLWGTVEKLGEVVGIFWPVANRLRFEQDVAAARAHLSADEWEMAWAAGRAMPLEQAIATALDRAAQE